MDSIKEIVKKAFESEIGQQCMTLYSTCDGKILIRLEEAMLHVDGKLDPNTEPLSDKRIIEWYEFDDGVVCAAFVHNDFDLKSVIQDAHEWQLVTFPGATPVSKLKHLEDEVRELIESLGNSNATQKEIEDEYADCFLLLFGSAYKNGYDMSKIAQMINSKMVINKSRKWREPNDDGVVYHEKEGE